MSTLDEDRINSLAVKLCAEEHGTFRLGCRERHVDMARHLLAAVGEVYRPAGVTIWLNGKNKSLDWRTPVQEPERALVLLESAASGAAS